MNFQMVKLSLSAVKDSDAQKLSSSQCWSENKCQVSTKSPINLSLSAMLISEKTCITTSLWVVEQLCSQVSQKDLARKLLLWLHQPWKSRSSPHKKENSSSGLVDQSCHHCQPSKQCGSPKPNIKKAVLKSFIENVSDNNKDLLFSKFFLFDQMNKFTFWRVSNFTKYERIRSIFLILNGIFSKLHDKNI